MSLVADTSLDNNSATISWSTFDILLKECVLLQNAQHSIKSQALRWFLLVFAS
jgi:hypothetical protein